MTSTPAEPYSLKGQRILLASEYIGHGGTRTYFRDLLLFYSDAGADVVALTTHEAPDLEMRRFVSGLSFKLYSFEEAVKEFGIARQALRPSVWNKHRVAEEVGFFGRMCDILGIQRVVLSVGTSGLFLSATHSRPNPVMIAHGYPYGRRQRLLGKLILGRVLPPDLTIVAVSDFSGALFRRVWGTESRGVQVQTVRSTCGHVPPLAGLAKRKPIVVTAALLESYKEPFTWIEVAQRVLRSLPEESNCKFLWMGDGSLLDAARKRIPEQFKDSIDFPGWMDEPLSAYYDARVYLQTSSEESLGLSVVDALRIGLPPVVTSAGGLPEVVADGITGFVVPTGDVQSASEAVQELLLDDHQWSTFASAAQDSYRERFSPELWKRGLMEAHNPTSQCDE